MLGFREMARALVLALAAVGWAITIAPAVGADVTLRVGAYQNAPKIFHDESGRVQGFWPDLIEVIVAKKGWATEYVTCEWAKCLEMLENGALDMMPDVAYSATRAARFSFGKEIVFHSWSQLFYKPGKSISGILDLSGLRVAALSGSIQEERLVQRLKEFGISSRFVQVNSLKAALSAVKEGAADLGVVNRFLGARLAPEIGLLPSGIVIAPSAVHFAFSPTTSSRIIAGFDEAIAGLKLDGGSILYRGLVKLSTSNTRTIIPRSVYWAIGVGLLFLVFSFGSILLLRRVVANRTRDLREEIRERKQAEEALRRTQKMEAIGQLSGGIAHDFNNQLGVIIGYLDFLKKHFPEDEKPRQWVETATKAALRCTDLTRQLLAFSRDQGQGKVVVDLNAVLKDMENMVARSLTPEIDVQYFLADDLKMTEIDPGEFQDVILNLVINARDAMPGGGKLLIETTNNDLDADYAALNPGVEPGGYLQLILSDTGAGMDKETLEHVFEPFFTTKPKGTGTGLGLAMVYGFVKRYGGNIEIFSEPGVGTTIRIYLPCSTVSESVPIHRDTGVDVLPTGSETILIVDDEEDLLQLADQYLSGLGYHTRLAENAAQALEILTTEEEIDLLFSDVVMPGGMSGYELAQQAAEQRPGLKVLLTSGYTAKTVANNGLARFAAHLLSKPYRKDDLALRIRLVLDEALERVGNPPGLHHKKGNLTGRTILLMDDEEDIRELFKINLEMLGCNTVPACNGDEAIALYQQSLESGKPIDVIVLDLTIPGSMGGKEIAEKLRAMDPDAKMIVASGHTEGPEMTHYQDYGFQGALEKNFNRKKIKQVLEQVLTSD